ncbi:MAG TPA: hypothetical protein PJ994_10770 [Tepidiformaceae bacterium]|nr:hypothetical protein [Tepidiformaceae bacterium]
MHELIDLLGPIRKELVVAIKERRAATAQELADTLFLSIAATRAHLGSLERARLITVERRRHGVGRPTNVYRLSPRGESLFPQGYADLSKKLLAIVQRETDSREGVVDAMQESHEECLLPAVTAADPSRRARQIANALGRRGFDLDLEQRGRTKFEMRINHCPLLEVAAEFPVICEVERRTVASAAGAGVTAEHLARQADGHPHCLAVMRWPTAPGA